MFRDNSTKIPEHFGILWPCFYSVDVLFIEMLSAAMICPPYPSSPIVLTVCSFDLSSERAPKHCTAEVGKNTDRRQTDRLGMSAFGEWSGQRNYRVYASCLGRRPFRLRLETAAAAERKEVGGVTAGYAEDREKESTNAAEREKKRTVQSGNYHFRQQFTIKTLKIIWLNITYLCLAPLLWVTRLGRLSYWHQATLTRSVERQVQYFSLAISWEFECAR
jgi:hypothetical protein